MPRELHELDELTAHRWRREGAFCPRRDGKGSPCGHLLEWEAGDPPHLSCERHGEVFQVQVVRAA